MDKVTVLSRSAASREAFANYFQGMGLKISAGHNPEQAVKEADLIITITNADEVLVRSNWVADAATVVSMGGGQELDFDLFDRASAVFVDDLEGCLESGDLAAAQSAGRYQNEWIEGTLANRFNARKKQNNDNTARDHNSGKIAGPAILIPRGMAAMDVMQAYRALEKLGYSLAVSSDQAKGGVG
jgi:ornithine cyclodeaminase/alanine dehydrogenase-like protein (mu-crystallin family)